MKIAVLGAGAYGEALGGILEENKYKVTYFDPKIKDSDLTTVLDGAKYTLLAVPSEAAVDLLDKLPRNLSLIVATKGFLSTEVFDDFKKYMIVSGPGFANDIKVEKKTKLTVTDAKIAELLATDFITFDFTSDKRGVLMCGALKNVYAIYAGMLGIKPGTTKHELYIDSATNELKEILTANGAKADTVELSCGRGDLIITCGPPSRNYEFGQMLKKDMIAKPEKTVEGVATLRRVQKGEIIMPDTAKILKELVEISKKWD